MKKREFYVNKRGIPVRVVGLIDDLHTSEGTLKIGIHKVEPKHRVNDYEFEWEMVELTTGLKLCNFKSTVKGKVPTTPEFVNKVIAALKGKQDVADNFKKEILKRDKELPEYLY